MSIIAEKRNGQVLLAVVDTSSSTIRYYWRTWHPDGSRLHAGGRSFLEKAKHSADVHLEKARITGGAWA